MPGRDRRDRHRRAEQQHSLNVHAAGQADDDDERHRAPGDQAEHLRQRAELLLQRRAGALDRGEHRGDLAHLRLHAGAVTTIAPVPRVTDVFWNSMFVRSPSATSSPGSTAASFAIGALSPVSAASCVSSVAERRMRPSAGTMSPASTCTMSPGTTSTAGTRTTRAVAHDLRLRDLHVRQRVDARPRLQLLPRAEHDVEQDQQRDDDAGRDLADHEAHDRDGDEHDVHRVAQLLPRDRPERRGLLARRSRSGRRAPCAPTPGCHSARRAAEPSCRDDVRGLTVNTGP